MKSGKPPRSIFFKKAPGGHTQFTIYVNLL